MPEKFTKLYHKIRKKCWKVAEILSMWLTNLLRISCHFSAIFTIII
jgi:hypothetical protein